MRKIAEAMFIFATLSLCACGGGGGSGVQTTSNSASGGGSASSQIYLISGVVRGLDSGKQITLLNNSADATTVSANGVFTLGSPIPSNGVYSVTIGMQPTGQICSISNGSGFRTDGNVSNITVACSPACNTTIDGVLASNAHYGVSGSPYCIANSLQIPTGVSATFDAGSTIIGGSIVVQGALNINGTVSNQVNIANVEIKPAGVQGSNHAIYIQGANITSGSLYKATGNAIYGSLTLIDSTITGTPYLYLWYPVGVNLISRNKFFATGGISFGVSFQDTQNVLQSLTIENNRFSGWTTEFALRSWAYYGSGAVLVQKNTFIVTKGYAAELPGGYSTAVLDMANNDWGTTDASLIAGYIYDKNDDITSAGFVTFQPVLSAPDVNTPAN